MPSVEYAAGGPQHEPHSRTSEAGEQPVSNPSPYSTDRGPAVDALSKSRGEFGVAAHVADEGFEVETAGASDGRHGGA